MCDISGWAPRPLTSHYIAAMAISRALSGGRLSPAVLSGITTEVVYMLLYFRGQASSCGMRASTSLVTHGWADSTMPSGPTSQMARLSWVARYVLVWPCPEVILGAHALHMLLLGDFGYYYIKPSTQTNLGFRQSSKMWSRCDLVARDLLP